MVVVQIQTRVQTQRFVICISAIPVVQWVPEESGHFYCVLVKHTQNTARMGFEPVLFGLEWNGRETRGTTLKLQYSIYYYYYYYILLSILMYLVIKSLLRIQLYT